MPNQIVLAWTVDVAKTVFGPTQAAAALAAVPLHVPVPSPGIPMTDPVLGQLLGLTLASDVTTSGGTTATRTMTLNMTPPDAPAPFPCHPRTSTPPSLEEPFPLRTTKTLPGSFFVETGSMSVPTTATQLPSLNVGDSIQFLSQQGVFYVVASLSSTAIGISAPYTGVSGNTSAFKEVPAPVTIAAMYSTSDLDTDGVATEPVIPAGPGARTVVINYIDPDGGSRTGTCSLTGKRPAAVVLEAGKAIAAIANISIASVGGFGNSVGEITLVGLSSALPALPPNLPIGTGIGAAETTIGKVGAPVPRTFKTMTDEAQLLIDRHLMYLPPSYFALAQQGASKPQLTGDFFVTTGSTNVPTEEDQTSALASGNIIEFADQIGTLYTIADITPKIMTLTTEYTGIDTNNTGLVNTGTNNNVGTKGNIGTEVIKKATGATLVFPSPAAAPSNDQLSGPLGQFVAPGVAMPPLNPPLIPATIPAPTFLSGLFTRTIQLALAGVPVVSATITFV